MKTMNEVYLLYTTNAWHDRNSMQLIAVCSSLDNAVKLAKRDARGSREGLSEYDVEGLTEYKQTQCRDTNYMITSATVDELE